jgi:tetratricopeptide (TPR) repeat protein
MAVQGSRARRELGGGREVAASLASIPAAIPAAIAIAAAVIVYLPALRNGFVWDDPLVLQQLRAIRSWSDLVVLPPLIPKFYYRPLIFVSYLIDRTLGGETPFWFHASVIAVHAVNTALVFQLARRLFADTVIAGLGALLFAVHPAHVESVAWMAGRSDVIVCAFMLATILLLQRRDRLWSAWLGGATYLLGLLSKESALAVLLLAPLLDGLQTRRLYWMRYLPLGLATLLYFSLRQLNLGALIGGMPTTHAVDQLGLDVLRAIGFYAVQTVAPLQLSAYVPQVPGDLSFLIAGLLLIAAASDGAAFAWQRRQWAVVLLIAWFFVTLAPSLAVILRRSASAVVADRYLYVPSVAACLLAAWAVVRLTSIRALSAIWPAGVCVAVSLLFGFQTWTYTRVWADSLSFWIDVATKTPNDALPQREVGLALMERGRFAEAEAAFQRALALPSDGEGRVMVLSNLGSLYRRSGRFDDAVQAIEAALQIGPHPALYHNLGMTLMSKIQKEQSAGDEAAIRRDIVRAHDAFESALNYEGKPEAAAFLQQWSPAKSHSLLGQVMLSMGDPTGARQHLEAALQLEPTGPIADVTRQYMSRLPR